MALSSTTTRTSYSGDGSTTSFGTGFKFLANSHVQVVLRDSNGAETTWVEGTQYTLTGAGAASGTVLVDTSPTDYTPESGETLVIIRVAPNTQGSSLPLGGAFPSTTVEEALDLAAMRDQQLDEKIGRSLLLPISSSTSDLTLPEPEAGKVLGWNAAADALENQTPNTGAYLSVTAFAQTLLDDTTAAAARTTLGVEIGTDVKAHYAAGQEPATATNDNAAAGKVGEYTESEVLIGSAVSLTTGTAANITSLSLTAGDWLVWGSVAFNPNGATTVTTRAGWISTTSATLPAIPNKGAQVSFPYSTTGLASAHPVGIRRLSLSATTTVYLTAYSDFGVNTNVAYGIICAQRAR